MSELQRVLERLGIAYPERGFVFTSPAERWEDGTIVGNGTQGALCFARPYSEEMVLSHEALFLPIYPAGEFIPLEQHMDRIRELVLEGKGRDAMELTNDLAKAAGCERHTFTDPFIGACSLKIEMPPRICKLYARSTDFETGNAVVAWEDDSGLLHRRAFASRKDGVVAVEVKSPTGARFDIALELARIERDLDCELYDRAVAETLRSADEDFLGFRVRFNELSEGQSLLGYCVGMRAVQTAGRSSVNGYALEVSGAERVLLLVDIQPEFAGHPVTPGGLREKLEGLPANYDRLLAAHADVHSDIFGRVSLSLCDRSDEKIETSELQSSSRVGNTSPALIQKAFDAGRYGTVSSTGRLPPALQGIWTGTWRPNWSGDFTLNGNVQSAVAASLSGNHYECLRATLDYLSGLMDDFRACARELFGFRGIYVPWRSSTHGRVHSTGYESPHRTFPGMYWFAGTAWWAWLHYDYWLYTGDEDFFKQQLKPYFLEAADFVEDYLCVERDGKFVLVPSYSPENRPAGGHCLQPNSTMTIASIKQLLRTLLKIADKLGVDRARRDRWRDMLSKMPDYMVDPSGALAEWAWPAVTNNENHRHASHLYPVYDGVDPEIAGDPGLREACRVAIEKRLEYRRPKNGGEMAFGLTQLGMSASYLRDKALAYECVEWLANSYWSPAMVSQHDPDNILNLDISGGLQAVIINMLVQSGEPESPDAPWRIFVLPCLPSQWPSGSLEGVRCRGGFEVSFAWADKEVSELRMTSLRGEKCVMEFNGRIEEVAVKSGETWQWRRDD